MESSDVQDILCLLEHKDLFHLFYAAYFFIIPYLSRKNKRVIFMFFTAGHKEVMLSFGAASMTMLLWGCLSVVISYVLAFLPAVITAGIAKLAHVILDAML